jgi:hypothetical protein
MSECIVVNDSMVLTAKVGMVRTAICLLDRNSMLDPSTV